MAKRKYLNCRQMNYSKMIGQDAVGNTASYDVIGMSSGKLNEIKLSLAMHKAKCLIDVPKRQAMK